MEKAFDRQEFDEKRQGLDEFFTPQWVVEIMWKLAKYHGFTGGNVLEPSFGDGRFLKLAPDESKAYGFEIFKNNFEKAKADLPKAHLYNSEFETAFLQEPTYRKLLKKSWLPEMDLIIGNPPYGKHVSKYSYFFNERTPNLETFFILKGIELLKRKGLLIFIIPSNFLRNGDRYSKVKERICKDATMIDAFRLPNNIFEKTSIGTDIVVFKKS